MCLQNSFQRHDRQHVQHPLCCVCVFWFSPCVLFLILLLSTFRFNAAWATAGLSNCKCVYQCIMLLSLSHPLCVCMHLFTILIFSLYCKLVQMREFIFLSAGERWIKPRLRDNIFVGRQTLSCSLVIWVYFLFKNVISLYCLHYVKTCITCSLTKLDTWNLWDLIKGVSKNLLNIFWGLLGVYSLWTMLPCFTPSWSSLLPTPQLTCGGHISPRMSWSYFCYFLQTIHEKIYFLLWWILSTSYPQCTTSVTM